MGNILTYLKWRGDLTFRERAFCEVDNLVLAELSYLDFSGIVPSPEQGGEISIEAAAEKYYTGPKRENRCSDGPPTDFLSILAKSARYQKVLLSKYVERLDEDLQTDFSAIHITLGDGTVYVAYRGTSDWLVGWREDFSMSFQLMPAQELAAEYLKTTVSKDSDLKYRVGGHSKGGNLAVYASMTYPAKGQDRIIEIYSNDGPGFCEELFDMEQYSKIQSRLIRIVPQFSVIGSLFEHEFPARIVKSSGNGVYQHDGMTWQIEGDAFLTCEERSEKCEFYNSLLDRWIESASMEQRKEFTNDLFDALEAGGAKKGSDLAKTGFENFEGILLSVVQSDRKTKIVIGKLFQSLFKTFRSIQFKKLIHEKEMIRGGMLFLAGLVLMVVPEFAARFLGVSLGGAVVIWIGKKQLDCAFSEKETVLQKKQRMILQMILMCIVVFLVAQQSFLLRFSGVLLGCLFLYTAFQQFRNAFDKSRGKATRIGYIILGSFSFLMGMVPVVSLGLTLWRYVFTAGIR